MVWKKNFSDSGRKSWVICSPIPGYIDIEVDIKALEKLRHSMEVVTAKSISVAIEKNSILCTKTNSSSLGNGARILHV